MKGIAMLHHGVRRWRKASALAVVVIALACASLGNARAAEDEDEDVPADTKFLRGFMSVLGLQRDGTGIEYRERAPLVVPPSRDLPAPQTESVTARNPAWPKDPDRRKQAAAAEKAKLNGDRPTEEGRPLRPDELNVKGGAVTSPGKAAQSAEESARPMSPDQLGASTQKFFEKMWGYVGPARPEATPFTGEPPRTTMTAPPAGYQTPSAGQPYGVDPTRREAQKPSTLDQRLEPTR
jgi:hypothetical protein